MVSKIVIRSNNSDTKGHRWRDKLRSSNSDMKGRLRSSNSNVMKGLHLSKGRKWKDLHLSSNDQHRRWNSVEWNAGVITAEAEACSKVQTIITSVEEDLEEGMVKMIVPM